MVHLPQHIRDEHLELRAHIEVLRTVADSIGIASTEMMREGVGQVYSFLIHQLIPPDLMLVDERLLMHHGIDLAPQLRIMQDLQEIPLLLFNS
jgi:hypothetical protein